MGIQLQDLPTDPDQLGTDSEIFFEDGDTAANAVVILAQLDPTEVVDGQPRWSADQMKVITNAKEMYGTWAE